MCRRRHRFTFPSHIFCPSRNSTGERETHIRSSSHRTVWATIRRCTAMKRSVEEVEQRADCVVCRDRQPCMHLFQRHMPFHIHICPQCELDHVNLTPPSPAFLPTLSLSRARSLDQYVSWPRPHPPPLSPSRLERTSRQTA